MKIVLFGAPGSGKGTMAKKINAEFNWPQISTGDLLRSHIAKGTELGKTAKAYIDKGQLVPDELVIKLVKERINEEDCKNGYILDGFPRTFEQAIQLDKIDNIDIVIYLDISMEDVKERAKYRRICPACGKIFAIKETGLLNCDDCNTLLVHRDDDQQEVVEKRITTYLNQSQPLIEYYEKHNILERVKGADTPEATYAEARKVILSLLGKK